MSECSTNDSTRRDFIKKVVALTAVMPVVPQLFSGIPSAIAASTGSAPLAVTASTYRMLTRDEASFTEAMVNALCPADRLTPDGVTCGLASSVDSVLAGEWGAKVCAKPPMTQAQFFKAGIAAANRASQVRFGARFDQLDAADAGRLLAEIASGRVADAQVPLTDWSHQKDRLLVQACYSGPIYDGYSNKVFWKVFGQA